MALDRLLAQEELLGDLRVGQAVDDEVRDLELPPAERGQARPLRLRGPCFASTAGGRACPAPARPGRGGTGRCTRRTPRRPAPAARRLSRCRRRPAGRARQAPARPRGSVRAPSSPAWAAARSAASAASAGFALREEQLAAGALGPRPRHRQAGLVGGLGGEGRGFLGDGEVADGDGGPRDLHRRVRPPASRHLRRARAAHPLDQDLQPVFAAPRLVERDPIAEPRPAADRAVSQGVGQLARLGPVLHGGLDVTLDRLREREVQQAPGEPQVVAAEPRHLDRLREDGDAAVDVAEHPRAGPEHRHERGGERRAAGGAADAKPPVRVLGPSGKWSRYISAALRQPIASRRIARSSSLIASIIGATLDRTSSACSTRPARAHAITSDAHRGGLKRDVVDLLGGGDRVLAPRDHLVELALEEPVHQLRDQQRDALLRLRLRGRDRAVQALRGLVALPEGLLEGGAADRQAHAQIVLVLAHGLERLDGRLVGAVEVAERGQQAGQRKQQLLTGGRVGALREQPQRRAQPARGARRRAAPLTRGRRRGAARSPRRRRAVPPAPRGGRARRARRFRRGEGRRRRRGWRGGFRAGPRRRSPRGPAGGETGSASARRWGARGPSTRACRARRGPSSLSRPAARMDRSRLNGSPTTAEAFTSERSSSESASSSRLIARPTASGAPPSRGRRLRRLTAPGAPARAGRTGCLRCPRRACRRCPLPPTSAAASSRPRGARRTMPRVSSSSAAAISDITAESRRRVR